jgi:hypothetical protein
MKVQLTPAALREVGVLRASGYKGAGFLLGDEIGRFTIIDRLVALDFDRAGGDAAYRSLCSGYRQRLQGVFFCRRRPFALDWFLHDLVLLIGGDQLEWRGCEFSAKKGKAVLVPCWEDEEEQWPN